MIEGQMIQSFAALLICGFLCCNVEQEASDLNPLWTEVSKLPLVITFGVWKHTQGTFGWILLLYIY